MTLPTNDAPRSDLDALAAIPAGRPVLLLDFDGTVCVGDGPIWAYADAVIAEIAETAGGGAHAGAADSIRNRLEAFLTGGAQPDYVDGYAAVAALAADYVTREQLQAAYHASRRALAGSAITVHAPEGLDGFLRALDGSIARVVVTNAPDDGVHSTLAALELDSVIDTVVTNARKPGGWDRILPPLLRERDPATVMAVGDIWINDLQPPWQAGCCTALIDRFGRRPGPAHVSAPRFEDLFDDIRRWIADPAAFAAAHLQLRDRTDRPPSR